MLDSASATSGSSALDSKPDFIEFLSDELKADAQEVTALLGRWLIDYRPLASYEIRVLKPHAH
jgi:hypothetical protein